jgi:hypothetical protein
VNTNQPTRPIGPRPVRPAAPTSPAPSHLIRPNAPDHRLFRGWGITL